MGALLSTGDLVLLKLCIHRAKNEPDKAGFWLTVGMGMRYLLTILVLGVSLFVPQVNAVAVILTLLLQKIWLTIHSLRK